MALPLKELDQFFVHELVVVGNSQDDDLFASEGMAVLLVQFGAMASLHHKDEIRPVDLIVG